MIFCSLVLFRVTSEPHYLVWQVCFADMPAQEADVVFQGSSKEACALASGMLCLDPRNRTSALEALQHR